MIDSQKTWKWMMTLSGNTRQLKWHDYQKGQIVGAWNALITNTVMLTCMWTSQKNSLTGKDNMFYWTEHQSQQKRYVTSLTHLSYSTEQTDRRRDRHAKAAWLCNVQGKWNHLTQLYAHCGAKTALSPASPIIHDNSTLIYSTSTSQEWFYEPKMMSKAFSDSVISQQF